MTAAESARGPGEPLDLIAEANRQFTICNACRYCEGYCAVFPAMELSSAVTESRLDYLANLCHDCRACYQACMYTDPHEWAIDIPALMVQARVESYQRYSRPRWLRSMFERGPLALGAITAAAFAVLVLFELLLGSGTQLTTAQHGRGAFYRIVSHLALVVPGVAISMWFIAILGIGVLSFWRGTGEPLRDLVNMRLWVAASRELAMFTWMGGGGDGCYFPDEERPSESRRRLHALVVYGFFATFASTVAAFGIETITGSRPPYPWLSAPVILGLAGGLAVIIGATGMLGLSRREQQSSGAAGASRSGNGFLLSLLSLAVTGLLLLVLRSTDAMPMLLLVHLSTVLALYLTIPYGKMVHAVYRAAAVLLSVKERGVHG